MVEWNRAQVRLFIVAWQLLIWGMAGGQVLPQKRAVPYADSLYKSYQKPRQPLDQRAEKALQLSALYQQLLNSSAETGLSENTLKSISDRQIQVQRYIDSSLSQWPQQLQRQFHTMTIDFNSTDCDSLSRVLLVVHPDQLDSFQQSIYYYTRHLCMNVEKASKKLAVRLVNRAVSLLPHDKKFHPVRIRYFIRLGHLYYEKLQPDSALYFYKRNQDLFAQLQLDAYYYIAGYGWVQGDYGLGRNYMNTGLTLEKQGMLVEAIAYYEKAIDIYSAKKAYAGLLWGQECLMNALFDVGDNRFAVKVLRSTVVNLKEWESDKMHKPLNYTILGLLDELDLAEISHNLPLVDSVFRLSHYRQLISDFSEEHAANWLLSSQYKAFVRSVNMELLLDKLKGSNERKLGNLLDTLSLLNKHAAELADKNESIKYQQQYVFAKCMELMWKYSLQGNELYLKELDELLGQKSTEGIRGTLYRFATWAFHVGGKYRAEQDYCRQLAWEYKSGGHLLELTKLYLQMAISYQLSADYKTALAMRNKYDSLVNPSLNLQFHAQVARLNKELQVAEANRAKAEFAAQNALLQERRMVLIFSVVGLVVLVLLISSVFYINRKRIQEKHAQAEKEKIWLQKDNQHKEAEMERVTLELLKSNTAFGQLLADMEKLTSNLTAENRKTARSLLIEHKNKAQEDIWHQFNLQFQRHYHNFYKKLLAQFNALTQTEQRICAMHLSGLSSKEISAITGQSLNAVYAHKSNLRKKTNTQSDEELYSRLQQIAAA
ncbi:hypothetical protein GC194_11815 [bacterium]|nr:hypothetical protein [bacterium]